MVVCSSLHCAALTLTKSVLSASLSCCAVGKRWQSQPSCQHSSFRAAFKPWHDDGSSGAAWSRCRSTSTTQCEGVMQEHSKIKYMATCMLLRYSCWPVKILPTCSMCIYSTAGSRLKACAVWMLSWPVCSVHTCLHLATSTGRHAQTLHPTIEKACSLHGASFAVCSTMPDN